MGFNFFQALDPILWVLNEYHAHFMCFDTVKDHKVILSDRTISLPCILQFRCHFLRFPNVHKIVRGIFD